MREIIVELNLNGNGEIIPIFPNNFNFKNKMK